VRELNDILESLEPSLGPLDRSPEPLEGGITNRNYRVRFGDREYVVRLHGKDTELLGISREAERLANEAAARLGIAPAVAAGFEGGLVTCYLRCEALGERAVGERAAEIAGALRSFHDLELVLPVRFWVPDLLLHYAALVRERGAALPEVFVRAQEIAGLLAAALVPRRWRPCHNDLLGGNLISSREEGRTMLVDWEYAGMGHPFFDLGNLSVNNGFGEIEDGRLLRAYLDRVPSARETATLKLMRVLSDVREGAWGVMQAHLSELDFDFDSYAEKHFGRMGEAVDGPDFGGWLAAVEG
jgi:thiamine kinase-like enzyme